MKKTNKKGFTLAELLIVVAIIAVLVAIAIPIFSSQLEKSRESADAANLRAAYAMGAAESLTQDGIAVTVGPVNLKQSGAFEKIDSTTKIGNFQLGGVTLTGAVYVHVSETGSVTIDATKGSDHFINFMGASGN